MKVLFGCQGSIVNLFYTLDQKLRKQGVISDTAYWISDSEFFFASSTSDYLTDNERIQALFEWDFTGRRSKVKYNGTNERLTEITDRYANINFWEVATVDRRIQYGGASKVRQKYTSNFNHEELFNIIFNTLDALDRLILNFSPDYIATFVPATYGDYLLAKMAEALEIPYLQLRSTKVENYVFLSDCLEAVPSYFRDEYAERYAGSKKLVNSCFVDDYVRAARASPAEYEGTIKKRRIRLSTVLVQLASSLKRRFIPINKIVRKDNHVPPPLLTWFHNDLARPYYEYTALQLMNLKYLSKSELKHKKYIFFPLHSEPEIALSIFGRSYQNQIEAVRSIAQSLPMDWVVVLKEHPRSVSYRSKSWYYKLIDIPNVYFSNIETKPYYLIKDSVAVVTISGFVGFEAAILGKPVLVLGDVLYSVLPRSMVRTISSGQSIRDALSDLIRNYKYDELAAYSFVDTCVSLGTPANLYTDLLHKPGRNKTEDVTIEHQYENLVELFKNRLSK